MTSNNLANKPVVAIAKADEYDDIKVYEAIKRCLELIGGLNSVIRRDNKVFVKVNQGVPPSPPERGIVTHPVFLKAFLKILKEYSPNITVGDDVDSHDIEGFRLSGLSQACEDEGVRLVNLREHGFVETAFDGLLVKKIYISKIALEADVIINLPKLKTHSLTTYTGGIKNMFGAITKGQRARFHYEHMKVEDFCKMLTDVFAAIRPRLTVMDGIHAMEGEGPGSGNIKKLGIILASFDTIALDTVATKIIGLEPSSILTTRWASERGLGVGNLPDIDVVGEDIEDVAVSDMKLPVSYYSRIVNRVPSFLHKFIRDQMIVRPRVITSLCTGCFECKKTCPAGAVIKTNGVARIDKSKCIQCMCCHEVCRFYAIKPGRQFFGNLLYLAAKIQRKSARKISRMRR